MRTPGLLGRSIVASVLVAAVASVATAVLTADTARLTTAREQAQVAVVDQDITARLEQFGRGQHSWSSAARLLQKMAATSDRVIVVADLDGTELAASTGVNDASTRSPTAVLDPLAAVLEEAVSTVPTEPDTLTLPPTLLAARPGGDELQAQPVRGARIAWSCGEVSGPDENDREPPWVSIPTRCAEILPADAEYEAGATGELARLQNAVAWEERQCLNRRAVPAQLTRRFADSDSAGADLVVIQLLPQGTDPTTVPARVISAWQDCATAVLTRHLRTLVAPSAVLYVSDARPDQSDLLDRIGGRRILVALAIILLAAVVASFVASHRVLRPVRRLTVATQAMGAGQLATRVPVTGRDEVARLGHSFNDMARALTDADAQRRRMVSDIAHELRTPLANLKGYLEAGRDGVLPRDDAWTDSLLEEAVLMQHVVEDLAVLALADAGRLEVWPIPGDVVETVDAALLSLWAQAQAKSVGLQRTGDDTALASHDPVRLRQVIANLVSNAVRHSGAATTVTVDVRAATGGPLKEPGVRIDVVDRGEGITEESLPHLFERFYRGDPSRSRDTGGNGLGLAIVEQLVHAHKGTVTAARRPGGGALFSVWLPRDPGSR